MEDKNISTKPHGFIFCTMDIGGYLLDGKPAGA
jgi:hypothetical protein